MDRCKICLEPVEGPDGIMDLNEDDLCDDCCAREERAKRAGKMWVDEDGICHDEGDQDEEDNEAKCDGGCGYDADDCHCDELIVCKRCGQNLSDWECLCAGGWTE